MRINQRGFWENHTGKGHQFDKDLASAIVNLFISHDVESVLDLGCGMGDYSKLFQDNKFSVQAFDGNPHTPNLTAGLGKVADLSEVFDCGQEVDAVLSLEVGEHIPARFEQTFMDNLVRSNPKILVLSWAIPKQPGDGHVNCRSNDYIISNIEMRGYKNDIVLSEHLRKAASLWWFKNTLMVFHKNLE